MEGQTVLEIRGLTKDWGGFAHRDVDLEVADGEFCVLLGPSGSGKSLLLELIAGFARPDKGVIAIAGRDVTGVPPEKRNVALVYQDQLLFPHISVQRNIEYGPKARGVDRQTTHKRVAGLSEMLHLEGLMHRRVTTLSVGQRQRVALARGLATEPDVLLLDEPFSSLDVPLRERLLSQLRALHRRTGVTILHVTHDRAEALSLGERFGVIRNGRVEQTGDASSIFDSPGSGFVARFTGGTNIYTGNARPDGTLSVFENGSMTLASTSLMAGPCRAVVRPENIILSRDPIATSARNRIEGVVETVAKRDFVFEVTARFGDERMTAVITKPSVDELGVKPGVPVFFSFKAGSVHLLQEESDGDPR